MKDDKISNEDGNQKQLDVEQNHDPKSIVQYKYDRFINHENPTFAIFPKKYFEIRNKIWSPFSMKIYKNISVGIILLHLLLLSGSILFMAFRGKEAKDDDEVKFEGVIASIIYGLAGLFAVKNSLQYSYLECLMRLKSKFIEFSLYML